MDVKWIKINTDMFEHRKIRYLRRLPEGNSMALMWVMLLTMAGRCNDGGRIRLTEHLPYSVADLGDELGFDEDFAAAALETMERLEMLRLEDDGTILILGWEEHQNVVGLDRIRDQNRLRKKNQREREKLQNEECHVTCHVTSRDGHATDIEEEKEEDKDLKKNKKMRQENLPLPSVFSQSLPEPPEAARRTYGEYHNVILDDEQFEKLSAEFPEDLKERIENLSTYLETTGKEYKSHYAVIRFWAKKEAKKAKKSAASHGKKQPQPNRIFRGEQQAVTDDEYDLIVL